MTPPSEPGPLSEGTAPSRPPEDHTPYVVFAHLTAFNNDLYRAVMGMFVRAKEQFRVHLRPEEVHTGLPEEAPAAVEPVAKALESLYTWGNLRQDPDTERVTAVEDLYRHRHIYQLTREGEAATGPRGLRRGVGAEGPAPGRRPGRPPPSCAPCWN
ncbi:DUF2397 family protein [Nocardiopsis alborubida]|uniref:DUF2397 family protein n=1 Tax=Nocardiopsis alborubida TaxID=146802 RepID=UPI00076E3B47|nr:DUF2397 family protein [Nocardiopsis alborubida]